MFRVFGAAFLVWFTVALTSLAAWITHVVVCIKTASWLFLIAGAICAPIGVIHGIGVWFGVW
jgi:hypothetical protein